MRKVTIRGNSLYFKDLHPGNDAVVLLVHGHPFNHIMWRYQYEILNKFRLVVPDLIGYGKSDYNFDKIFIEHQALDLVMLLDELNIDKVHLVGLSMGGQIIVEFCRLFPHRVQSLVICASTPKSETAISFQDRLNVASEILKDGMIQHTKKNIHKYININLSGMDSPVYNHLFQMMSTTKVQGAIASHRGRADRRDNYKYLSQIKVPTLVIAGEYDFFFPVAELRLVAERVQQGSLRIIKDSGHLPNMEKPEEFNDLLSQFYDEIEN